MGVNAGPRAGIADVQNRGLEMLAKVPHQRPHRSPSFTETVHHDHCWTIHTRNLGGLLDRFKGLEAIGLCALVQADVAGIQNAAGVAARPPLDTPIVMHQFVRPLHGVGDASEGCHPIGPTALRIRLRHGRCALRSQRFCTGSQAAKTARHNADCDDQALPRSHRNSFQPRFSNSATTCRTASS